MDILRAETKDHIDQIRNLFREYEAFLQDDLCFQGFEKDLTGLPGDYGPPNGALLLAVEGQQPVGCGALRKLSDKTCEMKRLYVRPTFRGLGIGKALSELAEEATHKGYAATFGYPRPSENGNDLVYSPRFCRMSLIATTRFPASCTGDWI